VTSGNRSEAVRAALATIIGERKENRKRDYTQLAKKKLSEAQ
jgi:Arc/MetJ-type ribon-helix-helix transcriptional regulator